MIPKPIDEITKADIDALLTAKVAERRTLDYKELLPGGVDDAKKEFLYDVTSFANASGGDLVFGVTDQKGTDGNRRGFRRLPTELRWQTSPSKSQDSRTCCSRVSRHE